ncbi:hypothetical protein [Dokdonella sp.]|uniref:hypothetical protein n=1 Tax=Dokdonella sp. TaxID=2291710 RepID=UPI003C667068
MHAQRLTEANILGYQLDRIMENGRAVHHYEVRGPETGSAIASFADRHSAEQFIVMRELGRLPGRGGTPAY